LPAVGALYDFRALFFSARRRPDKKKMTVVDMSFLGRCCEPRWRLKYSTQCAILANSGDALQIGMCCAVCYDAGRVELKKTGIGGFVFWQCTKDATKYHRQPVLVCFECNKNDASFWFDKDCRFTRFSVLTPLRPGQPDLVLEEDKVRRMMFLTEPNKRGVTCANVECGAAELENSADKFLCCSRCLKEHDRYVYYCRTACQREHYALHAPLCRVK
jgi:hypothetical protein